MKLIQNYEKSCKDIAEHVGYEGRIENYTISTEFINCFFTFFAEIEEIGWAEDKEDVIEQDREYYQEEVIKLYRGNELTLALIDCDGKYWIAFKTENDIKDEK